MRTSYAELDVKRSSLRDICTRVKKQREIRELTRCREQHEQCSTTIDRLEEVRREKEDKEVLTVVSEEWRVKSEKLMEEVQLLKKEKAEAEKRAKKQSKQVAKSMEDLETQVKNWKRKTEIANALLKTEKGTSEFLRETLNKE